MPAGDIPAGAEEPGMPTGVEDPGAPAGDISAGAEKLGMPTGVEAPHHAQQDGMPFIESFPFRATGVLLPDMSQGVPVFEALCNSLGPDNIWHPFQLQSDWDFAQCAKNRRLSSTVVTELLALDGVHILQYEFKVTTNNDKLDGWKPGTIVLQHSGAQSHHLSRPLPWWVLHGQGCVLH